MDLGNTEHGRVERIEVARDGGLQRLGQLHCRHDGIVPEVGHGCVGAFAFQRNPEQIASAHDWAGHNTECSRRHAGPVMQTKNRLHRELFKQAVIDHAFCATEAFFGGLENDIYGAVEIAVFCQVTRRSQ